MPFQCLTCKLRRSFSLWNRVKELTMQTANYCRKLAGLGILSSVFRAKSSFLPKMSEWAIRSKKRGIHTFTHFWWASWAIRSQSLISSERCEQIAHGRSFLVSNLSDSLTSLIWFEQNERFTHIAHKKRGNGQKWAIGSFF